ncbi:MAG TPA: bifunctional ADP-heptose synthase [Cryomorphaceae bacterium]|nr:bifunctional ADP-heptose synthase [Cryomorphaceae bacterium]
MTSTELKELFQNFNRLKVLVVGDVMVDAYLWGKVNRISPEAPVPVVQVTDKENRLGGAANVALNIASLGATPIICALAGNDLKGKEMAELMESQGMTTEGILFSEERPTTVKTRVISSHQHIVRVDEESLMPLSKLEEDQFLEQIGAVIESRKPDVFIFEDYNKGVLTPRVIKELSALAKAKGIPTAVDPKKNQFFDYVGVSLFKPNLKELAEGLKIEIDKSNLQTLEKAVEELEDRLHNDMSLITLSELGIYIKGKDGSKRIPAHIRNISDVSGAGDTVISVAALCLASGASENLIASLSNLAGGLVCEKVGVVPIDKKTLLDEAEKNIAEL